MDYMEEFGTPTVVVEVEVKKEEKAEAKTVPAPAQEDKTEKAAERRTKRGMILDFVRNFGLRASQKKEEKAADENKDPAAGDKTAKTAAKEVKGIKGDFKAIAEGFKKKGPAWGQVSGGDAKKKTSSPIKEVLKQKNQPKSK